MIFVSTSCLKENKSVKQVIKEYVKIGIKNIELGPTHKYEEGILEFIKNIKKRHNIQFTLHGYFPPQKEQLIVNLASQNQRIRKSSITHIKKMIDTALEISAELCSFHAGFLVDPEKLGQPFNKNIRCQYEDAYKTFLLSVIEICKYAKDKKIKIAFENNEASYYNLINGKNELLLMCEPYEFERLFMDLEKHGITNLGILLDLGHLKVSANNLNFDPHKFIKIFKDKIVEIHISENDGSTDQALSLKEDSWAVKVLQTTSFKDQIITLEAIKLDVEEIQNQTSLIRKSEIKVIR